MDILVVEEEESVRGVLVRFLTSLYPDGLTVAVASGAEALARIKVQKFGLLIIDVGMKPMDGIELAWQVRGIDLDAKMILMSGGTSLQIPPICGFLHKPFDREHLSIAITEMMSQ